MTLSSNGVVGDIGGTHARFALTLRQENNVIGLSSISTLRTADFPNFEAAYRTYISTIDPQPRKAVFAVASPVLDDEVKFTNLSWSMKASVLAERLGLEQARIINDFAAIAYAAPHLPENNIRSLSGGAFKLPERGVISVLGPGSGLGVGILIRESTGDRVYQAEGGHAGFAPADEIDAFILRFAAKRYARVSAERLISGPGLGLIYEALAELDGRVAAPPQTVALWDAAISGADPYAVAACKRWLMLLGTFAGDVALMHGASAVLLAGGILPRFGAVLDADALLDRYHAKGRFNPLMRRVPVGLIDHPEPGLIGAATLLC